MIKWFKTYIKNKIDKRLFEILDEQISKQNNPYNIEFKSENSFIGIPINLSGGKNIHIGSQSRIGKHGWISAVTSYTDQIFSPSLKIGNNVNIGNFACITCIDEIIIEDGCLFSEHVYISDHYHGFDPKHNISPASQPLYSKGPVYIGKNTFIGLRASILSGVSLGKHCVVGTNSVVTKSFPDYCMIAGIPGKVIKKYSLEKNEWLKV